MAKETASSNENNNLKLNEVTNDETSHPLYDKLYSIGVRFASNTFGQYFIRKTDRLLWIVENTAKWSVPQRFSETENSSPPPLIRPLNWILFIPALIALRLVRGGLSMLLLSIGKEPILPIQIVRTLQRHRRILRSLRYQGLKTIRLQNVERSIKSARKGLLSMLMSFASSILCSKGTFDESVKIVVKKNKSSIEDTPDRNKKRQLSEDESDNDEMNSSKEESNMKCGDLLNKYADLSEEADPDFNPDDELSVSEKDEASDEESDPEDVVSKSTEVKENGSEDMNGNVNHVEDDSSDQTNIADNSPNKPQSKIPVAQNNNHSGEANQQNGDLYQENSADRQRLRGCSCNGDDTFYSPIASPTPQEVDNKNQDDKNAVNTDKQNRNPKSPTPSQTDNHIENDKNAVNIEQQNGNQTQQPKPYFNKNRPRRYTNYKQKQRKHNEEGSSSTTTSTNNTQHQSETTKNKKKYSNNYNNNKFY